jgi:hypothetical protein
MADEPNRIAILHHRILARNLLINRDQHFFFADELKQVAELDTLSLDHLPDGHGRGDLAGKISFPIGGL